jgi:hypothetical protein
VNVWWCGDGRVWAIVEKVRCMEVEKMEWTKKKKNESALGGYAWAKAKKNESKERCAKGREFW